jgi:hypothetical protein
MSQQAIPEEFDCVVLTDHLTGLAPEYPRLHVSSGMDGTEIALEVCVEEGSGDPEVRTLRSLSFVVVDALALQEAIRRVLPVENCGEGS